MSSSSAKNSNANDDDDVDDRHRAPGFRFFPTEEELVGFYLRNKLEKKREEAMARVIPVLDIYNFDPWQLPGGGNEDRGQWFFFCPRQEREIHGGRPRRTTPTGYWKATGSPSWVYNSSNREACRVIGAKKTMVFYTGRAPGGRKTKWKMNEYRALQQDVASLASGAPKLHSEFSLCRVYLGTLRSFDRRPPVTTEAASSSTVTPPPAEGRSSNDGSHSGSSTVTPPPAEGRSSNDGSHSGNDAIHRSEEEAEGGEIDWDSLLQDWD
ncbi:uncharacterized protein A4U43_C09F850 [Asparagus officinalis]|uniref:NAC domain-containing protein n=1 Tax=Asparagus officinalis TaxID=4686 RepID=A0A5P1E4A5_ASPOF|nr:NAC domain-containing protein 90-like [Asparagus officinalis]ONK57471.1 uncharacterized protein A4U43_C09F850 [Asparagus officinalis]